MRGIRRACWRRLVGSGTGITISIIVLRGKIRCVRRVLVFLRLPRSIRIATARVKCMWSVRRRTSLSIARRVGRVLIIPSLPPIRVCSRVRVRVMQGTSACPSVSSIGTSRSCCANDGDRGVAFAIQSAFVWLCIFAHTSIESSIILVCACSDGVILTFVGATSNAE